MNKLLIRGEVTGPKQYIYVFKDDKRVESIGVDINDLNEIAFACIQKYNITNIDLSGARMYMQGIEKSLIESGLTNYNISNLSFKYI